jgi:hypothetical protein
LQRVPVTGTDREIGMGIAEFPANASKPRHKAAGLRWHTCLRAR